MDSGGTWTVPVPTVTFSPSRGVQLQNGLLAMFLRMKIKEARLQRQAELTEEESLELQELKKVIERIYH